MDRIKIPNETLMAASAVLEALELRRMARTWGERSPQMPFERPTAAQRRQEVIAEYIAIVTDLTGLDADTVRASFKA